MLFSFSFSFLGQFVVICFGYELILYFELYINSPFIFLFLFFSTKKIWGRDEFLSPSHCINFFASNHLFPLASCDCSDHFIWKNVKVAYVKIKLTTSQCHLRMLIMNILLSSSRKKISTISEDWIKHVAYSTCDLC